MSVEVLDSGGMTGGQLILRGVTVVDTRTGALSPGMSATISGGKLVQVAPADDAVPAGARIVDAQGKYLIPGFCDMHTHVLQEDHAPVDSCSLMLAHGVTGLRQMAGTTELLRARRNGTLNMGEHAPELLSLCGDLLLPMNVPTPEAGVAEVQRQKSEGADFIKTIFVSPKVFFATAAEAKRQGLDYDGHLSPGVDVIAASDAGMTVIEHLGPTELQLIGASKRGWLINFILKLRPPKPPDLSPEAMKKAGRIMIANPILGRLNVDATALTKTQRLIDSYSEAKVLKMAATFVKNGTWQCPTLIRNATMRLCDDARYTEAPELRFISAATRAFWSSVAKMFAAKVPPASRSTLKQLGEYELKLTKTFDEAGVKMMAGSDYGGGWVIPGFSLHQEFDLLADAGLSPLRVLQMTTLNAAEFLKRKKSMGSVEAGKDANLVLLDGNPIESVQNLHKIFGVVRAGSYYSREALEALKEEVAGRVAAPVPDAHDAADQAIA